MMVLVTGGAGFLGRAVVEQLEATGYEAFVPRSREYDLRTRLGVASVLADSTPDIVVHLAAAVGGIGANQAHPGRFLYDNLVMNAELMEQSRLAGVQKFVSIGTACSYPERAPLPLREDTIWDGYPSPVTAPYGLAKRLLLVQGQAYRAEYGFNVIHLIPVNLYGPGDNFDPETSHVMPALIRRFSEATRDSVPEVRCWGTGLATREFLYVEDAARAIVAATEGYDEPEPVNIGTGQEVAILGLVGKIAGLYGYRGEITWDASRPDGVDRRLMDVSRAATAFGFRAEIGLDEGLKQTVQWYEANAA